MKTKPYGFRYDFFWKQQKNEKFFLLIEEAEKEKLPSTLLDRATIHGHYFKGVIKKRKPLFLEKMICSLWYFVINDFEKLNLPVISKPVRSMISNFQKRNEIWEKVLFGSLWNLLFDWEKRRFLLKK